MVSNPQDSPLKISNTALAAYLVSEGFSVSRVERNGSSAYFVFENTDLSKAEPYIHQWESATALGNLVIFFNAYRNLLRRLKEGF